MAELHDALSDMDGPWRGRLGVTGSGYGGVSVGDCVRGGWELAKRVAADGAGTGLERFHGWR